MAGWSKDLGAAWQRRLPCAAFEESSLKPFSEPGRDQLLVEIGIIMGLLPQPPARLLELGSGTGWTSRFFASAEVFAQPNEIMRKGYRPREAPSPWDRLLAPKLGQLFRFAPAISTQTSHWGIVVLTTQHRYKLQNLSQSSTQPRPRGLPS
jgi:hypothetical protein